MHLTEEEVKNLFFFLDGHPKYDFLYAIVFFGVIYGMRREEVIGLKWDAIDFKKRRMIINHSVTGSGTIYREDAVKTDASYRTLGLSSTAITILQHVKERQENDKKDSKNAWLNVDNYVFTNQEGSPYLPNNITRHIRNAMREFGRPEITFHKLRHTFISNAFAHNWDVKKIQYWVGDEDASVVLNTYAHYTRMNENNDITALEEMTKGIDIKWTHRK